MYKLFTKHNFYIAAGSVFLNMILSSCTAHMAMPINLQNNSTKIPVEGRVFSAFTNRFNFGKYHISNIHRGWTKSSTTTILGYSSSKAEQKYEFSIGEFDNNLWAVKCAFDAHWDHIDLEGFLGGKLSLESSSNPQLVCKMVGYNNSEVATIIMSQPYDSNTLQGVISYDKTNIDISGTDKFSTSSLSISEPTGYVFSINGDPVGAVEVINSGNVWIGKSINQKSESLIAAASAAMLLYQDIKKTSKHNF